MTGRGAVLGAALVLAGLGAACGRSNLYFAAPQDSNSSPPPASAGEQEKVVLRPAARSDTTLAYDSRRRQTLLFGGWVIGTGLMNDTWAWDGSRWEQLKSKNTPRARFNHAAAYDEARGVMVVWGGIGCDGDNIGCHGLTDTWEWNGEDWTQKNPPQSPPNLGVISMTYDSDRHRVIVAGHKEIESFQLWEWDGETWARLPGPLTTLTFGALVAYDSSRHRLVLHLPLMGPTKPRPATWEWDGKDWAMAPPPSSDEYPQGPYLFLIFDSGRGRALLHTGDALFEWDGLEWTVRAGNKFPYFHIGQTMTYDSSRRRIVLYGGTRFESSATNQGTYENDVWELESE